MTERLASLLGIFVLIGIGYAFSVDRRRIPWRVVVVGTLLQAYLALFLVRFSWVPFVLTAAAGACLLILLADLARPLPAGLAAVAKGLGGLGVATVAIYGMAAGTGGARIALAAGVLLVGTIWISAPRAKPGLFRGLAVAGCAGVIALVWWGGLPHDFLFRAFAGIGDAVAWLIKFAEKGADTVFGPLRGHGGTAVFAIEVGSIILLFSALMSILYYVGFLPWLVGVLARALRSALGVSGAESLSVAANIFVGQTEAPLAIRPYLARMTESETTALMAGGFATIAGSVLGAYMSILSKAGLSRGPADLIAASVMSAPAAFVFAKLFVPETGVPETAGGAHLPRTDVGENLLDALTGGVTAGLKLAVNVIAMLLVFYALIAILNTAVNALTHAVGGSHAWSFQRIYGYLFYPFAFLMGVPPHDCVKVGQLVGTKTIFNEFVAYASLGKMVHAHEIARRSAILSTYALCGFANFMSIGIQIGGLSALAPTQRTVYARLAFRAMIAGALACQLTACIVGVLGNF